MKTPPPVVVAGARRRSGPGALATDDDWPGWPSGPQRTLGRKLDELR